MVVVLPIGNKPKFGINLALGSSCFVQCRGCYNHFGSTATRGGGLTASEIFRFVDRAKQVGLTKVTLSGGDPLTHPEIGAIVHGLRAMGMVVHLDTVGTAFLGRADLKFYGHGTVDAVPVGEIVSQVNRIGIPLDGHDQATAELFRRGRPTLFEDTVNLIEQLREYPVEVCVNTVVHRNNIDSMDQLARVITDLSPSIWQLFEFQATGPIAFRNKDAFQLAVGEFDEMAKRLPEWTEGSEVEVEAKSRETRREIYFMIDDSGLAWFPQTEGPDRIILGHITRDAGAVIRLLDSHLNRPDLSSGDQPIDSVA